MKHARCIPMLLAILLSTSVCHRWPKNITMDGIEYTKFRVTGETNAPNAPASIGLLKRETMIGNQKYKGWLHLRNNGTVAGGLLAQDTMVNGIGIPAATWIVFDAAQKLLRLHLPDNQTIQGHECIGSGRGIKGATVSFYPTGKLKYFFIPESKHIGKIPCKGGIFNMVRLHPNGQLMQCTLAESHMLDGKEYPKGTKIKRNPNGRLINL